MKKNIILLVLSAIMLLNCGFVFSQANNAYLDASNPKYKELLSVLDRNYLYNYFRGRFYNSETERRNAINIYTSALALYNQDRYEESIDNFILACKSNREAEGLGLNYYYLGLCLMDIGNYELAKKAFFETLFYFFESAEYNIGYSEDRNFDHFYPGLFSYDTNGIIRETYFAFYNIACIESLQNNIDSAYEYLCEAIYHGYPYISHIRVDEDLRNLFSDRRRLQLIEALYNAGSQNTVQGKIYDLYIPGGYIQFVNFSGSNRFEDFIRHQGGSSYDSGNYQIRNYIVFSDKFNTKFKYVRRFQGVDYHGRNYERLSMSEFYGGVDK